MFKLSNSIISSLDSVCGDSTALVDELRQKIVEQESVLSEYAEKRDQIEKASIPLKGNNDTDKLQWNFTNPFLSLHSVYFFNFIYLG